VVPADDPEDSTGESPPVRTEYFDDTTRTILSRNESPDVPFEFSVNPYRGCEHGCIYCYARPYHEYLGLSAGLDFETRIFVKTRAPELLHAALSHPRWRPSPLGLSGVTDPYQPIERTLALTRRCLAVLADLRQPVSVITKSALVVRDTDVLRELATHRAASVALSVTTLDEGLRRRLEPRAASADRRLDAIARLAKAGVPVGVMIAPIIPGLTDHEVPAILQRAADAGASFAGFIVLRLPHGVGVLFEDWLERHVPDRKAKVLHRVRDVRGGALNVARFGVRMRGEGPVAELIARMFHVSRERAGIPRGGHRLSTEAFRVPARAPTLFD
jgi:DNA repair photolyase